MAHKGNHRNADGMGTIRKKLLSAMGKSIPIGKGDARLAMTPELENKFSAQSAEVHKKRLQRKSKNLHEK